MKDFLAALEGHRTYMVIGAAVVLIIGDASGWWKMPEDLGRALQFAALCFIRAALPANKTQP